MYIYEKILKSDIFIQNDQIIFPFLAYFNGLVLIIEDKDFLRYFLYLYETYMMQYKVTVIK